jgi:hypothetical protein
LMKSHPGGIAERPAKGKAKCRCPETRRRGGKS